MTKLKLILYIASIFVAGFCSGGLVAVKLGPRLMFGGRPPDPAALWQAALNKRLDLTPEQMGKISPIVTEATTGFRNFLAERMLFTLEQTNARIAPNLTPEQREKFLQLAREQHDFICTRLGVPPDAPLSPSSGGPESRPPWMPPMPPNGRPAAFPDNRPQ